MFDIGGSELLVIGVVALIVVGPKDLPGMFRTLGQFTAKARGMAREFQRSMEAAANEAGVSDLSKDLKKMTSVQNMGLNTVKDAAKNAAAKSFNPDEQRKAIAEAEAAKTAMGESTKALAEKRAEEAKKAADTAREFNEKYMKKSAEAVAKPGKPKAATNATAKKITAKSTAPVKSVPAKGTSAKTVAPAKATAKPATAKTASANPEAAAKKPAAKKPVVKKPAAAKPAKAKT